MSVPKAALKLVAPPLSDAERLSQLLAQRAANVASLAETDAEIADLCRAWSAERGYFIPLRAEQVLRALEAGQ